MTRRLAAVLVAALAALGGVACSSNDTKEAVTIVSTDTECRVSDTTLAAGKHAFTLHNDGKKFTEAYVYGPSDRIVTERENVGPGTRAKFTASLSPGDYEIACKPGQTGDGIRKKIHVTGKASDAAPEKAADRALTITAKDYTFEGLGGFTVKKGQAVAFSMKNDGQKEHEFEVLDARGKALGEIGPTKPGATGTATIEFKKTGTYTYVCDIEDHKERGMKGTFTVS